MELIIEHLAKGIIGLPHSEAVSTLAEAVKRNGLPQIPTLSEDDVRDVLSASQIAIGTGHEEMANIAYRRMIAGIGDPSRNVGIILVAHSLGTRIPKHILNLIHVYRVLNGQPSPYSEGPSTERRTIETGAGGGQPGPYSQR